MRVRKRCAYATRLKRVILSLSQAEIQIFKNPIPLMIPDTLIASPTRRGNDQPPLDLLEQREKLIPHELRSCIRQRGGCTSRYPLGYERVMWRGQPQTCVVEIINRVEPRGQLRFCRSATGSKGICYDTCKDVRARINKLLTLSWLLSRYNRGCARPGACLPA